MGPAVVVAFALIVGVCLAALLGPAPAVLWAALALILLAAFFLERTGRETWRALVVFGVFAVIGALLLTAAGPARPTTVRTADHHNPVYSVISREAVSALGVERGGLLLAIVFGDQSQVDAVAKDDFRRAGLLHLFAASGFNVTLAAGFILLMARMARAPKLLAASLALASVVFYFWLVGPTPSVLRATVMSVLLYLAVFFGRRVDAIASTAVAAAVLLILHPSSLFDIGWQLSFAGLLGILLVAPKITELLNPGVRELAAPLTVTTGAQIAVAPIVLYYFGQVSTVALIANPVTTLAVAYTTGVGFAGSLIAYVHPGSGRLILASLAWPLDFISGATRLFASLPASNLQFEPSIINALVMVALVAGVAWLVRRRDSKLGLAGIVIFIVAVQAVGVWLDLGLTIQTHALTVNFLDIGEGDATLIKTKEGGVVLIDGGRDFSLLDRQLRRRGVRHVDILIVSHAHADHVGSLDELVKRYPVAQVLEPGYRQPTRAYADFKRAVAQARIPMKRARSGQRFRLGALRIDILWPRAPLLTGTASDINNNSVVAKFVYKKFSLLFPGDVQEEAISELVRLHTDLSAQVLKVSHQGSANGTTRAFLRRVRPKFAVISVGRNNPYGHPHRPTLVKLKEFVRRLGRTDNNGNITIDSDGRSASFATQR